MSVIAFDGLTKRFGDVVAVDDLTVELGRGRVIGLLGPNGAGKTTTLRLLLGLVAPTSGSATIDGRPYRALDEPIRHIGAVLEATSFHPGRRARDHLRVLAATAGLADHRVDDVLAEVGLAGAARRRVGGFSLGMRQRLGLAAALLGDPDVLVLDEPTNGLDPEGIRWLRDFLRAYAASGRTVLVSSHLLAEVAQTVDDVVVLAGGRLVAHAPLPELLSGRTVVRIRTPDAAALRAALDARGIQAELATAELVLAHGATCEAVGRAIAATGLVAYEIAQEHSDLEQAFLHLTTTTTGAPR
jgi:ABC-2 type transport system ATP-binding protein